MKTVLYLTDLYYVAKGRKYYEEDLFITSKLREHFNVLIGNPQQAISFLDTADFVVFRNTGSILQFEEYFKNFLEAVKEKGILTFNSFDGKADIQGKQYLLDLQEQGYPVIPTIENITRINDLGNSEKYIVKLKNGADSTGMEILSREELLASNPEKKLIQPLVNFQYEVSFYFLNDEFQYAMYAPDKEKRWDLTEYSATAEDLEFATKFISWNNMKRGITRVDACRLADDSLLLVELEDLNPFLSIELLSEEKGNRFLSNFIKALKEIPVRSHSENSRLSLLN